MANEQQIIEEAAAQSISSLLVAYLFFENI